jgi:D-alanine transaminase
MTRVIYVNGQYQPYDLANVHCEDRGYQFGDAIYEVIEVRDGQLVDETRHMERLDRSLGELHIRKPMTAAAWSRVLRETIRRNRVRNGIVYLQVSRGAAPRDFLFPAETTEPTVVCLARSTNRSANEARATAGIKVVTQPDPRWNRCDIKTVMLLPSSLAKEKAKASGAGEVWFTDDEGYVTEGGSSNAWIVTHAGELVTTPASTAILRGVTRMTLIDVAAEHQLKVVERRFTLEEAHAAKEAFISSASNLVTPVTAIDGNPVGDGKPGALALRLRAAFHDTAEMTA